FAHHVLGHDTPLLATTVTITSLGFVRDARPVRVLETAIGMTVGITLSEVLLLGIGRGAWQLFVIILATLLVARLLSSNAAFAVAAGVQAVLVALLPAPPGGVFVRSVDGLVGGAVALLA
ncbi:FUSC family protein, partial [Clavibacter nebraskensis]